MVKLFIIFRSIVGIAAVAGAVYLGINGYFWLAFWLVVFAFGTGFSISTEGEENV